MGKISKQFSWRRTVVFACVSILLFALLIEFVSFLVITKVVESSTLVKEKVVEHQFHPFMGWLSMPNMSVNTESPCGPLDAHIETDQHGYSIIPIHYDHPQMRIVITGGSTMFGVGQDINTHTIPSRLTKMLYDRLGIKAEVINLGQRGFRAFQEMSILNDWYSVGNQADVVLSISGANDAIMGFAEPNVKNVLVTQSHWNGPVRLVRRAENSKPDNKLLSFRINWERLAKKSYFFQSLYDLNNYVHHKQKSLSHSNKYVTKQLPPIPYKDIPLRVQVMADQYAAMQAITEQHGGTYVMFLQPTFFTKQSSTKQELNCVNTSLTHSGGMNLNYGVYEKSFYADFRRMRKHFNYIDLTNVLNKSKNMLYIDNVHYTNDAAAILASSVFENIKPILSDIQKRKMGEAMSANNG